MNKKLRVYFTSDTHGHLFPIDYATGKPSQTGLLGCLETYEKDGNTLVIDGGDTIQGSPFTLYSHSQASVTHPVATVLNRGHYDYVTLGNHDFNYGREHLNHYLTSLKAKCLCANVTDVTGTMPIYPADIKVLENGLRIGIVGVVTDHVNLWERPEHIQNLAISDAFTAAKRNLQLVKDRGADVTICIYHGGFECDLETGERQSDSSENIGSKICQELDFDLLLTGHQHRTIEGCVVNGTYVVQPPANAKQYLAIEGELTPSGITFKSEFKSPIATYQKDGLNLVLKVEEQVKKWLDAPVGYLDRPLDPRDKVTMALEGSSIVNFFHQVQFEATGAQISCTSLANDVKGFKQEVSVRDVVSTYVYPNTLCVLEITSSVLKAVLERSASYLDLDDDGKPKISDRFLIPKVEHYNYDFFAGITYTADLRRPVGKRVLEVLYDGKLIKEEDTFTICMNNYRLTGAGGYEVYKTCPIVKEGQIEMSELIINYLAKQEKVTVTHYPAPKFIY